MYVNKTSDLIKSVSPESQLLMIFVVEIIAKRKLIVMKENNWFFRLVNLIAWISGGIGLCFLILGLFQIAFGFVLLFLGSDRLGAGRLIPETEIINYFIASTSFFSVLILWFLIQVRNQLKTK